MSIAQHTLGPWISIARSTATEGVAISYYIGTADRSSIASGQSQEHMGDDGIHADECMANARLIAAAPELLAALEYCHSLLASTKHKGWEGDDAQKQAKAAIAKATGGAA